MKDIILLQIIPVSVFIAVFAGVFISIAGASIDPAAGVISFAFAAVCHLVTYITISDARINQELKKIK